jgi:hypothetical protein
MKCGITCMNSHFVLVTTSSLYYVAVEFASLTLKENTTLHHYKLINVV